MATLTIRNLPEEVRDRLRVRAAEKGRSMEAEAREVLSAAVAGTGVAGKKDARARVQRLQETMKPYRSTDRSVVGEFLAERREEVRREDEKVPRLARGAEAARDRVSPERETQVQKLERAQAILRRRVPEGTSLVDEFLAERRAMWAEE